MTKNKTDELDSTNVQGSADLARIQANKLLSEIAIEATELAEKSAQKAAEPAKKSIEMENLKDKLIGMWLNAPEETDSSELRTEIDAACIAGESAMEELLIKLLKTAETDGNEEESIIRKLSKQIDAERDELEKDKKMFRKVKLQNKLFKLLNGSEKTDSPELRTEIDVACDDGERAMEELLFKLMGTVQTDADVKESIRRKTPTLTNYEREILELEKRMIGNDKLEFDKLIRKDNSEDKLIRMNNLKDELIATWQSTPGKYSWVKAQKDWSKVRNEIFAACDAGESAMEELLIRWNRDKLKSEEMFRKIKLRDKLEQALLARSDGLPKMSKEVRDADLTWDESEMEELLNKMEREQEELIMRKNPKSGGVSGGYGRIDFNAEGTVIRSDLPTPSASAGPSPKR